MSREKGTGSVFYSNQRNQWVACVANGFSPSGGRKYKRMYCKSEAEAKRKLREFLRGKLQSDSQVQSTLSVQDYMNQWLETVKRRTMKPSGYDRLESTCVKQVYPSIGDIQIHGVTSMDIQEMLNDLSYKYSQSVLKKTYDAINSCMKYAVNSGIIDRNPANGVIVPKSSREKKEISVLTDKEVEQLKRECVKPFTRGKRGGYRLGYLYILLLNTGMRVGELSALEWSDVNLKGRSIRISKNASVVKNREGGATCSYVNVIYDTPKTKCSNRTIPINNAAMDALIHIKEVTGDCKYVAANQDGDFLKPEAITNTFKIIQKNCGFENLYGVHALRHTFATSLFRKNVDIKTVSTILGHSSTAITYNIYVHIIESLKVEALSLIDDI